MLTGNALKPKNTLIILAAIAAVAIVLLLAVVLVKRSGQPGAGKGASPAPAAAAPKKGQSGAEDRATSLSAGEGESAATPDLMKEFPAAISERLHLTDDQKKLLEEMKTKEPPKTQEEAKKQARKIEQTLTPEQRDQWRNLMKEYVTRRLQQPLEKNRDKLSPEQYEKIQKQLNQMKGLAEHVASPTTSTPTQPRQ